MYLQVDVHTSYPEAEKASHVKVNLKQKLKIIIFPGASRRHEKKEREEV